MYEKLQDSQRHQETMSGEELSVLVYDGNCQKPDLVVFLDNPAMNRLNRPCIIFE